ncbi:MAG: preprotein translocase subunit SecG [Chloroflexi bacterium]|nr:preprotein translocase subunit SecG [Chloroflexota bacterium]
MQTALNTVQILLGAVLVLALLLQAKGSGFSGIFGGGDSSAVYRTRRGFERRLFQFTIVLSVVFFLVALINSVISSPSV